MGCFFRVLGVADLVFVWGIVAQIWVFWADCWWSLGLGGVVKLVFVGWCWCCEFVVTEVIAFLGFEFYCAWWFWVCVGVQFV